MKMKVQEMVERLMVRQLLFLKWPIALLMWRNWGWRMVMRKQPQVLGRLALHSSCGTCCARRGGACPLLWNRLHLRPQVIVSFLPPQILQRVPQVHVELDHGCTNLLFSIWTAGCFLSLLLDENAWRFKAGCKVKGQVFEAPCQKQDFQQSMWDQPRVGRSLDRMPPLHVEEMGKAPNLSIGDKCLAMSSRKPLMD